MRSAIPLQQIQIRSPCNVAWESMRGTEAGVRFCEHCKLDVHNLSAMTSADAQVFVSRQTTRTCVAYVPAPQGGPITLDYQMRKRRFTWRWAVMVGMLGAALSAAAQAVLFKSKAAPTIPVVKGSMVAGGLCAPPPPRPTPAALR
jgi:hypothetical protein